MRAKRRKGKRQRIKMDFYKKGRRNLNEKRKKSDAPLQKKKSFIKERDFFFFKYRKLQRKLRERNLEENREMRGKAKIFPGKFKKGGKKKKILKSFLLYSEGINKHKPTVWLSRDKRENEIKRKMLLLGLVFFSF